MRAFLLTALLFAVACGPDESTEPTPDGGIELDAAPAPTVHDITAEWCWARYVCGLSRDDFNACVTDHAFCPYEPALTTCDEALADASCGTNDLISSTELDGCITACH